MSTWSGPARYQVSPGDVATIGLDTVAAWCVPLAVLVVATVSLTRLFMVGVGHLRLFRHLRRVRRHGMRWRRMRAGRRMVEVFVVPDRAEFGAVPYAAGVIHSMVVMPVAVCTTLPAPELRAVCSTSSRIAKSTTS